MSSEREIERLRSEIERLTQQIEQAKPGPSTTVSGSVDGSILSGVFLGSVTVTPSVAAIPIDDIDDTSVGAALALRLYGAEAPRAKQQRLVGYLKRLSVWLDTPVMSGIEESLRRGRTLSLSQIYTLLATREFVEFKRISSAQISQYFTGTTIDLPLREQYHPDYALPDQAVITTKGFSGQLGRRAPGGTLYRARLATEDVRAHAHVLLLGDPGSGKSTFARHLAWVLARRGLDQIDEQTKLIGWPDDERLFPIFLSLPKLASRVVIEKSQVWATEVERALREALSDFGIADLEKDLNDVLNSGAALLILDGLDEVPVTAIPGRIASREDTLTAICTFLQGYQQQIQVLITCRTRAFDDELRGVLPADWRVTTLAPFTLGQVRHFIGAWYAGLSPTQGELERTNRRDKLIDTIAQNDRLRALVGTPLLLILLLVTDTGDEPLRDRAQIFDRVFEQLLKSWDAPDRQLKLSDVIGHQDWHSEQLWPLFEQIAYEAHQGATTTDHRSRILQSKLFLKLTLFFETMGFMTPAESAWRALQYFEQRSDLLVPHEALSDDEKSYVFIHPTFQEHCVARYLARNIETAFELIQLHRGDDRWYEPIMLVAGLIEASRLNSILSYLLRKHENDVPKALLRWYRDIILAAEIGQERDWQRLRGPLIDVIDIQDRLRIGLVDSLHDIAQPLTLAERIRAGMLLGGLGDTRVPISNAAWQQAFAQRTEQFGDGGGNRTSFFCYIPGGRYQIGGWDANQRSEEITLEPFWIARFPITVAQFQPFVDAGYADQTTFWTPSGETWRRSAKRKEPRLWQTRPYSTPNQPVVGISWYEALAYCSWLNRELADILPAGYSLRLPTEAEWEVAASYRPDGRQIYPWGADPPTIERCISQAVGRRSPAPIGVCPGGVAASGAFEMAGNASEYCLSDAAAYPTGSAIPLTDLAPTELRVAWRGGSWFDGDHALAITTRSSDFPGVGELYRGMRLVLACKAP
jgi:formylglycine-generating enzyme required for sulfatase activity